MSEAAHHAFVRALAAPEPELDLGRAALLIAQVEDRRVDVEHYIRRLDAMADSISSEVALEADPARQVAVLSRFLFITEGFRGNSAHYYDPRNSFLNHVMDRKLGIPITLSTVYLELARRLGLPIVGVGFPGHFMVKYVVDDREILIDPFRRGAIIGPAECRRLLQEMSDGEIAFRPEHLQAVSKRQILIRTLANLKHIYLRARNLSKMIRTMDLILLVDLDDATEVRDRGVILAQTGRFGPALRDLERYLVLRPQAPDAETIKEQMAAIRRRIASMN